MHIDKFSADVSKKPLVSVVILTLNRRRAIQMCLDSIYAQDYSNKEIIVIDNGSSESTINLIKSEAQKGMIRFILNKTNIGACNGRNQGFLMSKGEYILFADSDIVMMDKSTISKAIDEINNFEDLGELGGIGFSDKELTKIQHGRLKINKNFELNYSTLYQIPPKIDFNVDYAQSDFILLKRQAFEKVGGFDPFYVYYLEDVDLSVRMKKAGFKVAITPKIKFWHQYIPRRAEINHSYFYKIIYLSFKMFSVHRGLAYYFHTIKTGIKNTPTIAKRFLLALWNFGSLLFLAWLTILFILIRLRERINFLSKERKFFDRISEKCLKLPMAVENAVISAVGILLFWIKRKRRRMGLYLFVTQKCNNACIHCFLKKTEASCVKDEELNITEIEKAYNSLRKKIGGITITGGEPFLREDLVDICKIFQIPPHVSNITFNTNGFSPEKIGRQMEIILKNAPAKQKISIIVSLDGFEEMHDSIRKTKGAFKNAVNTILLLKKFMQEYQNFRVKAQFTLMEYNYKDFYQLFGYITDNLKVEYSFNWFRNGEAYGIDQRLLVEPAFSNENDKSLKLPAIEKCEEVYEFLLENRWQDLNANLINKYTLKILKEKKSPFSCTAPALNLVLYSNGDLSFCELIKPIKNIRMCNHDIKSILKSKKWQKISGAVNRCCCIHPCTLALSLQKRHFLDIKLEGLRGFVNKPH